MSIKIYDSSLKFRAEIDNYESLIITRVHGDRSSIILNINRNKNNVEYLVKGAFIRKSNEKYIYKITGTPKTKGNAKNEIQVKAYDVFWEFDGRVVNDTLNAITHIGKSIEWLIKKYIDFNIVNPTDPGRKISYITLAPNQDRGDIVNDTVLQTSLEVEIKRLLANNQMGLAGKLIDGKIEVDVYEGTDRSVGNAEGNSIVSFDIKYNNIKSLEEDDSNTFTKNYILVAGGKDSRVLTSYGTATGAERRESFLSFDDITDIEELKNRGKASVVEDVKKIEASVDALKGSFEYGVDYYVGDIVTVAGTPLRVMQAEIVEQSSKADELLLTFGSVDMMLNTQVKNNATRISRLETKTGGSGGGGSADMTKATYDPNNVNGDVFDRSNHTGTQPETTLSFGDNTNGNATTQKHGFLRKLSGVATQFLNGLGNWVAGREVLTADRTYYVSPTGSDSNDGLTASACFKTIQRAYDVIASTIDGAGYSITIKVHDGIYASGLLAYKSLVGVEKLRLEGNPTMPINVKVNCFHFGAAGTYEIDGFSVSYTNPPQYSACILSGAANAFVSVYNVDFGAVVGGFHAYVALNGYIRLYDYSISGNALWHIFNDGGIIECYNTTVNLIGTPNFQIFAYARGSRGYSNITTSGITYVGNVVGKRYQVDGHSNINTFGGGSNYFPGTIDGSANNYGIYN